ncbi:terminase large subunit domain-containing protein [Dongia sp.]|uniref:terminase large subunit domain-containing protein n=1 Tax=Dongia sp. TaxID=1977262 RepID=UPI0035ADA17A
MQQTPLPRPTKKRSVRQVHLYAPRPAQAELHGKLKRFNVLVAHRRFGKTVFCINELIARAAASKAREPRYGYVAPLLTQAKDIAWTYLKRFTAPIPKITVSETELWVELPNGARIRLYGADNPDRLRGLYFDGVVLDEYAQMSPHVWPEIVRPMLADRAGWALFIGTPMGRNHFHALYDRATRDDDWLAARFPASSTRILPEVELAAAQRAMSPEQFAQEFECSFSAGVPGAYYATLLDVAERDGRLSRVPWEPRLPVITAWDLGIGDATAIWFAQLVGSEIRIIDYFEASGVALGHYVKHLDSLPYVYGEHLLPHDVAVRELGTGTTRLETLRQLGVRAKVLKASALEDGIEAVRALLPRCWFDAEKCARGLDALRLYRRGFDAKQNTFSTRPLHDWTSHAADALRYLAAGLPPLPKPWIERPQPVEYDPMKW